MTAKEQRFCSSQRCLPGLAKDLRHNLRAGGSEANLSASPVSALGVVPDGVVRLVADPVWQGTILLDHLAHLNLFVE